MTSGKPVAIDDDTIELLERRMSERVESNVRSRLFKVYFTVGGGVLAALAYFGYDVIDSTRDRAREAAESYAKSVAEEAVGPSVAAAQEAAKIANAEAADAAAMLNFLTDWMTQRTQKLSDIEDDVQKTIAGIQKVTKNLEEEIKGVSGQIKANEEALDGQRKRALDFYAGQGDLSQLADQLISLSTQVKELDARISTLPPSEAPVTTGTDIESPTQTAIQEIIDKSGEIIIAPEAGQEATVYLQFAGVERSVAEALSAYLVAENFTLPGEERTGVAAGLHEVRFYFPEDKSAATKLAALVNQWLASKSFEDAVIVRDFSVYGSAKPKPGVLELWLEPKKPA